MKSATHARSFVKTRRGSALISVIILSTVALLFAGSLIGWSLTERKLTIRHALLLESRNAAEALAEYGFSQIRQKYETRGYANLSPSGSDALKMPPAAFWANSNVSTATGDVEIVGGTVQTKSSGGSNYYYVDPDNPNNANDPLKGKWVWRRDVSVVAKATVKHPTGGNIVSYATQSISVRGAPLFAHAIFYNMDLELAPGPEMHIYGPVHANGDLYLASQGTASLNFHGQVTASGNLYHAWKYGIQGSHNSEGAIKDGHVNFANRDGTLVSMRGGQTSGKYTWNDSLMGGTSLSSNFRAYASNTWNGNLLTSAHGITNYNPVAIGEYREASATNPSVAATDSTKTPSNAGRLIIEPSNYPTDTTAADYKSRMEIESQKYANDAGILIKVTPPTIPGGTPTYEVTSRDNQNPAKNKTLTLPTVNKVVDYRPYKATQTYTSTVNKSQSKTTVTVASSAETSGPNKGKYKVTTKYDTVTTPETTTYTRSLYSAGYTDTAGSSANGSSTTTKLKNDDVVYVAKADRPANDTTYGTITSGAPTLSTPTSPALAADNKGIYDRRRGKGVDLIDVDMDALRKAVGAMAGASSAKLSDGSNATVTAATDGFGNLQPSDWTGIVYIEIAGGPTTNTSTGATNYGSGALATAANATAVRIVKGKGKVPSYGTENEGLTIATNTSMYVQGNYNADGTISTNASTHSAHVPETGEVPAALVADTITLLSEGFDISKTTSTNKPVTLSGVEISAALLMGISPTNAGNNRENSGGAHNFPRFLEDWKHPTYIRGSLVSLFESRVATEPWSTDYYAPPARNWGFNDLFASGRYPPGTPRVMSYRRVDFTNLDAAEYAEVKKGFNW